MLELRALVRALVQAVVLVLVPAPPTNALRLWLPRVWKLRTCAALLQRSQVIGACSCVVRCARARARVCCCCICVGSSPGRNVWWRGYRYVLHSVLVHHGTAGGGHYYAFVKPRPVREPHRASLDGDDAASDVGATGDGATKGGRQPAPGVEERPASASSSGPTSPARQRAAKRSRAAAGLEGDGARDALRNGGDSVADSDEADDGDGVKVDRQGDVLEWYRFDDSSVSPASLAEAVVATRGNPPFDGDVASAHGMLPLPGCAACGVLCAAVVTCCVLVTACTGTWKRRAVDYGSFSSGNAYVALVCVCVCVCVCMS